MIDALSLFYSSRLVPSIIYCGPRVDAAVIANLSLLFLSFSSNLGGSI
jgi:hypothetical protein